MMEPRIRVSALLRRGERVLLCRHEKVGRHYWLLPGGGVNGGETLVRALQRELTEELGIEEDLPLEGPIAVASRSARRAHRRRDTSSTSSSRGTSATGRSSA